MAAFEAALPAEHRRLLRYFQRRVGRDAAPDLVQEAFARLYGCEKLATLEQPQAYLTTIARNMLINRARQQKRRASTVFFPLDDERDAPTRAEQEWRIEEVDLRRILRRAVLAMPRRTRRIFLMHRLRRLTYRQIAEELGVCIQTVEHHMMRALARCRRAVAAR
jgi:RNA polymerase sigma-70 factor (ECF subfamily)